MSESNQTRALAIFMEVIEKPQTERSAFVQFACGGDDALLADVQSLLDSHARAGDFMANPTASAPAGQGAGEDLLKSPGTSIGPYKLPSPENEMLPKNRSKTCLSVR